MLSICVPIYNHDVRALTEALARQVDALEVPCEIVFIDDGSSEEFVKLNRAACRRHVYVELGENIGRARIRNLFTEHARFDHFLYLDCDSVIAAEDFLDKYVDRIRSETTPAVYCGGRVQMERQPPKNRTLRWKYSRYREGKPAEQRRLHPYRSFLTPNFAVHRSVIEQIGFDEFIATYGHEDTLFGYRLKQAQIPVNHIDNPVLNGHLETNAEYVRKTEIAVANLPLIMQHVEDVGTLIEDIALLSFYYRMRERGTYRLYAPILRWARPVLRGLLVGGWSNLKILDLYKLAVLDRHLSDDKRFEPRRVEE